jgi:MEMO1 family protein
MDDRPRLRPLDGYPVEHKGKKLFALRDPSMLAEEVVLPPEVVAIVQLCDGQATRDEICAEFHQRYRKQLARKDLDDLLAQLDQRLLLDSENFRQHSAKVFGEFARAEVRPPQFAGKSYPRDPARLAATLDGYFEAPHGPGKPEPGTKPLPRAIIAPHIDFPRGGPAYGWAYRPLADARELPEAIVVLGTDHFGALRTFTATTKHYDTPLGKVTTDVELVKALVDKTSQLDNGGSALLSEEHHHRGEHSIEFQMVWLRHLLGEKLDKIPVVPLLCGSLHEYIEAPKDPAQAGNVGGILSVLLELLGNRRVLWIAGADLAHVGPQFGDDSALTKEDHASLEKRDHETLRSVAAGDAAAWLGAIRAEKDSRRVCGLSPIYAMLLAARPGAGRLTVYAQCPAEAGSVVSIASLVFPGSPSTAS